MDAENTITDHCDEREAKEFLLQAGVLIIYPDCPWCGSLQVKHIRRDKFRCPVCRHEWGMRKGSILEGTKIPLITFINIVRLYAEDLTVNDAAHRIGVAYNTVYEIFHRIRMAVLNDSYGRTPVGRSKRESISSVAKLGVPEKMMKPVKIVRVFGIRLKNDLVFIEPVKRPDSSMISNLPVPKVKRGNLLFIDAYEKKYQGFIAYVSDGANDERNMRLMMDELPWSPLTEFWCFAGKKWTNHRGLTPDKFQEFVHELAFRYNHRNIDLFATIIRRIARTHPCS
jgi:transposase-like protein